MEGQLTDFGYLEVSRFVSAAKTQGRITEPHWILLSAIHYHLGVAVHSDAVIDDTVLGYADQENTTLLLTKPAELALFEFPSLPRGQFAQLPLRTDMVNGGAEHLDTEIMRITRMPIIPGLHGSVDATQSQQAIANRSSHAIAIFLPKEDLSNILDDVLTQLGANFSYFL